MRPSRKPAKPDPHAVMITCDLCTRSFQFGPHRYDGKPLNHYQMSVCSICLSSNWDGVGPIYEPIFEAHLIAHSIALPQRNSKGWYPL